MPPHTLPEYRLTARNTSRQSENLIHDDATARRYGFGGGLVPGVTVYAYLTRPLVAEFGAAWLDRGTASVRFAKPIFEGDEVVVAASVTEQGATGASVSLVARNGRGDECALMSATIPAGSPTPVNAAPYRELPLPAERPAASREHFLATTDLGNPVTPYDEARAAEYLAKVDDTLALYRGPRARVHPAVYLEQSNRALSGNVRVGPWIHAGSAIRHLGPVYVGDTVRTLGRVRSLYEKKGREFVELDLLLVTGERRRPVAHVLHTAIYRLPEPTG